MKKKVSKQRAWQLRKAASGLCVQCGKRPLVTANHCEPCRQEINARRPRYAVKPIDRGAKSA